LPGYDLTSFAVNIPPDAPALYNKDGSINWALTSSGNTTWTGSLNPIAQALATYQNKTQNLIASSLLSYEILPGLSIKSNFGYNRLMVNEVNGIPLTVYQPSIRPTQVRSAVYSNSVINSWIIEPQINYKRLLAKGDLDVLIGETIQQNANNGYALSGSGYSSDVLLSDIRSAATITPISSVASTYKYNALFGRINYRWKDRYILDFTGRRDGSSRFGPANEFHDFWALGGAWIFSEESFLKDHLDWLSFGKIRGSYGTTGNDQIGDYQFLNLYTAVSVGTPYQNTAGLATNAIPNPYLQWEETRKIQAGIELGFLKDRILITANYVRNRSSNELLSYGLPSIAGFGSVLRNFPATIENSDWDGIFRATIFKGKNFTWASSLNLTVPKNKLVDFPNLANSTYSNTLIVGQPINIIKVYHFMGVDPTTGVYTFADSHNNPTTSPTQQTTFVSTTPKFYGGFRNEFTYRQFHLDVLFQFVKQIGQNDFFGGGSSGILPPGYNRINQPTSVLARWQKQGDQAPVEKFNSNLSLLGSMLNIGASDAAYTDASFIRLKTLSLTYQFNDKLARKAKLKDCQIYLRGENLLTITKYKGMDPENQKVVFLPPLRMLTIGLQIGI
jgi:TonB-linked SusC/RagA family outer membrane protein